MKWANLGGKFPIRFTANSNDDMFTDKEGGIVISTYAMLSMAERDKNFSSSRNKTIRK